MNALSSIWSLSEIGPKLLHPDPDPSTLKPVETWAGSYEGSQTRTVPGPSTYLELVLINELPGVGALPVDSMARAGRREGGEGVLRAAA